MTERDNATRNHTRPEDIADLDRRLSEQLRARKTVEKEQDAEQGRAWSGAMRISGDMIAGLLVGGGLGWLIDQMAGSAPWGLLVGLGLGFAAGIRNVMLTARKLDAERAAASADADKRHGN